MIQAVFPNGYKHSPDKSCYDCYYCKALVTWWCCNKQARKLNYGSVGYANCDYWKPALTKDNLSWFDKLFGDYVLMD